MRPFVVCHIDRAWFGILTALEIYSMREVAQGARPSKTVRTAAAAATTKIATAAAAAAA